MLFSQSIRSDWVCEVPFPEVVSKYSRIWANKHLGFYSGWRHLVSGGLWGRVSFGMNGKICIGCRNVYGRRCHQYFWNLIITRQNDEICNYEWTWSIFHEDVRLRSEKNGRKWYERRNSEVSRNTAFRGMNGGVVFSRFYQLSVVYLLGNFPPDTTEPVTFSNKAEKCTKIHKLYFFPERGRRHPSRLRHQIDFPATKRKTHHPNNSRRGVTCFQRIVRAHGP